MPRSSTEPTRKRGARPRAGRSGAAPEDFHAERLQRGKGGAGATAVTMSEESAEMRRGIGRRVRELRLARGLNVKGLATAANVTPGMISQVERGNVTPSIATLLRIAAAVGSSIGDFFDTMAPAGMVVRADQRATYAWPLTGVRDQLLSSDPTGRLQVFWSQLEPGATSGPELLQHGSEAEFVLVVSGAMVIVLGEQRVRLEAGDTITFSGDIPHGFENPDDVPAEVVWVMTPASY